MHVMVNPISSSFQSHSIPIEMEAFCQLPLVSTMYAHPHNTHVILSSSLDLDKSFKFHFNWWVRLPMFKLKMPKKCFNIMANDFLAMDRPAASTVPSGPLHNTESEPAPKQTNKSKSIITFSLNKLSDL